VRRDSTRRSPGSPQAGGQGRAGDHPQIAGIGNIYADEILLQARLHPGVLTNALDWATQHRLFNAMNQVLRTAV